jgi:hypothetical protein
MRSFSPLGIPLLRLQPFIEDGQPLGRLFPPPEALFLPACLAISAAVAFICIHVGTLVAADAVSSG